VRLGPGPAAQSYLRQEELLAAARATGAQAVHPGYGFLSENADFAEACAAAGVVFIGPTPAQMRDFGLKHLARDLAARNGVALLPGSAILADVEAARREATRIGYPVMLKSTAGGGGIGMQLVRRAADLDEAFTSVERLATKNFNRGGVFLEKYIERAMARAPSSRWASGIAPPSGATRKSSKRHRLRDCPMRRAQLCMTLPCGWRRRSTTNLPGPLNLSTMWEPDVSISSR
jgi:hypothetical protein